MGGDVGLKGERILREAEAAAQLAHPNLVTLHDVGHCEHGPYLVMELLRGRTLGERLLGGPLPLGDALHVAIEVAKGVAHAHARGVIHRDVTPGNVFLCEDGQVKVLDFGLALAFGRSRVHAGTVAYMAPEQWRREPEDERTDVFALGVVLHEMLTGAQPFRSPEDVASSVGAPRLALAGAGRLADLLVRMMANEPARRPRDGGEVLSELLALDREFRSAPAPAARLRSGRRRVAAVAFAALAAVAVALALSRPTPVGGANAARPSALASAAGPERPPPAPPAPPAIDAPGPRPTAAPVSSAPPPRRPSRARPAGAVRECRGAIATIPAPPAASGDGVLTVVADPFGAIAVDGIPRGDTPRECRVAAGTYTIRAVHPTLGSARPASGSTPAPG